MSPGLQKKKRQKNDVSFHHVQGSMLEGFQKKSHAFILKTAPMKYCNSSISRCIFFFFINISKWGCASSLMSLCDCCWSCHTVMHLSLSVLVPASKLTEWVSAAWDKIPEAEHPFIPRNHIIVEKGWQSWQIRGI